MKKLERERNEREVGFILLGLILGAILNLGTAAMYDITTMYFDKMCGIENLRCIQWSKLGLYIFSLALTVFIIRKLLRDINK